MYDFDRVLDRSNTGSLKWDKYQGKDVVPLWVADMDFVSAPEIVQALDVRKNHEVFGYTKPYADVVDAVVEYLANTHQMKVEPDWLCWIPGLVPALNVTARAFGEAGDEILTCTPVYPPFLSAPVWQGKQLVTSMLKLENDAWTFDFEDLEQKVTPKTKVFFLCNPHNPVGRVYRRDELEKVAAFCQKHDLVICSDEIHCDLVFDKAKHIPIANLSPEIAERTMTLMAPSKTYNLPGLCCSFVVIPNPKLRMQFMRASRGFITEVNTFGYAGCAAAYKQGEPWRQSLMAYLKQNRDFLYQYMETHFPQIKMWPMEATYLAWMQIDALGLEHPASFFEEHGVGLSNGMDFGDKRFLRLNFGCPRSVLEQGLERMKAALEQK